MYRVLKPFIFLFLLFVLTPGKSFSQSTSSPYSMFGLGNTERSSIGPSIGMGGTGIAIPSDKYVNLLNPASYSGLDSLMSIFEVGVFGKYTTFNSGRDHQALVNSNLKYIIMGFRISPRIAASFGFAPFSSVGYKINTQTQLEGTPTFYTKTFSGEGGVNQAYVGASLKVLKNLSLGVNAAYLFGNVTRVESSSIFDFTLKDITYVSNIHFNYGLNYKINAGKWDYNLGLTYGGAKKLITENISTIETTYEKETLKERKYKYGVPETIGGGVAATKGFFRVGADYEWSNWNNVEFKNLNLQTRNSNRYSLGLEFSSPGVRQGTPNMIFYRFGAEYRQSYVVVSNVPIDYKSFTIGAGLPLKGVLSVANLSLEAGQTGTLEKGLFRENYFILHLDMTLRAQWFEKKRYR